MGRRVNLGGLVIAGIGFFLTRFTVALAIFEEPARFYVAGVVPLALGLGLAAFGIALAVADVDPALVRTTAAWCAIGAGTMLVLAVLTLIGVTAGGGPEFDSARSRTYLSNFLIGGSVGGTLTGLYAARNRRQRGDLRHQKRRLQVLNRLLRHEVLNAVTVIRGYARTGPEGGPDAAAAIEEYAEEIEGTIEEVKHLTRGESPAASAGDGVALGPVLRDAAAAVRDRHPDATIAVADAEGVGVRADERLGEVFTQLLENAVVHDPGAVQTVALRVEPRGDQVRVTVSDQGPGLPAGQRRLLETGEIQEFDDPSAGFGLNVVRLFVERYGGDVETAVDETGTDVTVVLPSATHDQGAFDTSLADPGAVRPAMPQLTITLLSALVAGVVYGVVAEQFGGSVAFIGVYYGVESTVVGWLTHQFHSVVFAFVFAGLVSLTPSRYHGRVTPHVAVGVAWGITLWILAAGVVSPIWLRLVGIPASVPSLSTMLLFSHVVWGATLGALTAVGYRHATPVIADAWAWTRRAAALGAR